MCVLAGEFEDAGFEGSSCDRFGRPWTLKETLLEPSEGFTAKEFFLQWGLAVETEV